MGISNRQDLLSGRAKSCGCFKRRQAEKEAESLIGKRYGRLTITGYELKARLNNPKKREIYYHCKCDCGNEIVTTKNNLKSGGTQSCGCQSKEKRQKYVESIKIDLTRKKFGRLTVIKQSDKHGDQRQAYWECVCDCGSKTTALGQQLRLGETQSCGCLLSGGEEKIGSLLSMVGIDFKREQVFLDLVNEKNYHYRYDFGVKDKEGNLSYIIEYDGKQHFWPRYYSGWVTKSQVEKTHLHDDIKNQYCFDNNISLIRIPFIHKNDITIDDLLVETSPFVISSKEQMQEYRNKYTLGQEPKE